VGPTFVTTKASAGARQGDHTHISVQQSQVRLRTNCAGSRSASVDKIDITELLSRVSGRCPSITKRLLRSTSVTIALAP
jgi:hypothetical protein